MTDGQFRFPGRLNAGTLAGNFDDWAPSGTTGIGRSTAIFFDCSADRTVTGILAEAVTGGGTGVLRVLILVNDGSANSMLLPGNDAGSAAANRFAWTGTKTIGPGEIAVLLYDRADLLWRPFAMPSSGGGTPGGSTTQVQFNNAGAFDGDANLTWDDTNSQLLATHLRVAGKLSMAGDVSVTLSASPGDGWSPSGITSAGILRINPDTADVSILGLPAPVSPYADGRVLFLVNVGTAGYSVNVINESGAETTAANRFLVGGNVSMGPNQGMVFIYDAVTSRWRCYGMMGPAVHTHTSSVTGGTLDAAALGSGVVATARLASTGTASSSTFLRGDQAWAAPAGGGDALTSGSLAQFASTTSAELATVLSDETGSGAAVFATSPTLVTPVLGTPASGTLTNCTSLPPSGVTASASDVLLGRVSASGGAVEEVACTDLAQSLLDDATQGAMQTTLGVDPAGTDNSTDVTLAGTPDYLTLAGQVITRGLVDLTTDVTGATPIANGGTALSSYTAGDLIYCSATDTLSKLAKGTSRQAFRMNSGATAPEWHTPALSRSITIKDPGAADDATMFFTPVAITVTDVRSHITGTTNVVFNINHASTRTGTGLDVFTSDITLTSTAGQSNASGFNDETIPANSWVWVDIVSVSGTPSMFHATVIYTED